MFNVFNFFNRREKNKLFLSYSSLKSVTPTFFKTACFFYDEIFLDIDKVFLEKHFDNNIKNEQVIVGDYYEIGKKGDLNDLIDKIWDGTSSNYNSKSKLIKTKCKKHKTFELNLLYPYYWRSMTPIISKDIFIPIRNAYFQHYEINPNGYLDMISGKSTTLYKEDLIAIEVNNKISSQLIKLFRDAYFSQTLGYQPVYDEDSILMSKLIKELPNFNLKEIKNGLNIKKVFPKQDSLHQILNITTHENINFSIESYKTTLNLVINNLDDVPLNEIEKFRKKDKISSLHEHCKNLIEKNSNIQPKEIVESLNEHMSKLLSDLKPQKKQIFIDVLSNIPLPIKVNPVGLFSLFINTKTNVETNSKCKFIFEYARFKNKFGKKHNNF